MLPGANADEIRLRLAGPLTLDNIFEFQKTWREQQAPNIVVDLTEVPYVDSSGIGSLVNMHVSREKAGGRVDLVGVAKRVHDTLVVTRVDRVLNIATQSASPAN